MKKYITHVKRAVAKAGPHMQHAEHATTCVVATAVAMQIHVLEVLASGVLAFVVVIAMVAEWEKPDA